VWCDRRRLAGSHVKFAVLTTLVLARRWPRRGRIHGRAARLDAFGVAADRIDDGHLAAVRGRGLGLLLRVPAARQKRRAGEHQDGREQCQVPALG